MFTTLKKILKNGIRKNAKHLMMVIYIKVQVQGYQCLTNMLWTMCHVKAPLLMSIDSSNRKGNAERGSEKYLAEKKRLEVSSSGIWMIYLLWVYSVLVKTMQFLGIGYRIGWYEVSYRTTQYKNCNGLSNQQVNMR